jgi:hypothetical protein
MARIEAFFTSLKMCCSATNSNTRILWKLGLNVLRNQHNVSKESTVSDRNAWCACISKSSSPAKSYTLLTFGEPLEKTIGFPCVKFLEIWLDANRFFRLISSHESMKTITSSPAKFRNERTSHVSIYHNVTLDNDVIAAIFCVIQIAFSVHKVKSDLISVFVKFHYDVS